MRYLFVGRRLEKIKREMREIFPELVCTGTLITEEHPVLKDGLKNYYKALKSESGEFYLEKIEGEELEKIKDFNKIFSKKLKGK